MELTLKQRKWIKLYLELGNATEAAMQVYDCKDRDSAAQIGYENLRKLDFGRLMEEAGITDKLLLNTIAEGLHATKFIKSAINIKDSLIHKEDVTRPDHQTRFRYVEAALKLKHRLVEGQAVEDDRQLPVPIMGGTALQTIK